ncbi:MAG: hypothetical protein PUC06_09400 [Oscillospiraceae bacterium]|nr:hypothetical protein [Oscillospiraceae bacterium]
MRKVKGKRDWVKNAIIVFLVVLLILTFFSNTIMNYSLPEVAAQYPTSTTIVTKIRGNGTVEAAQSYNVSISETRTVSAVHVKVGDEVAAGDALLTLEESDSEELLTARAEYNALKLEYDKMMLESGSQNNSDAEKLSQAEAAVSQAEADLSDAKNYESALAGYRDDEAYYQEILDEAKKDLEYWNSQVTFESNIDPDPATNLDLAEAYSSQANAQAAVGYAQIDLEAAQSATASYQAEHSGVMSVESAQSALTAAQNALSDLKAAQADAAAQQSYDASVAELDRAAKEAELSAAEQKVQSLEAKAAKSEVLTSYAGVVSEVNVAAGNRTVADEPMIVIEIAGKGYTMKSTVTKEQARMLTPGTNAEVTNQYGSDISMVLTNVQADPSDPSGSRVLSFQVTGEDVVVGMQLSYSIGNKNASYDLVLPSSCIHTDSDGSFVYGVSVKSSPLGNRYSVKKCKVEVLASDDVNSAVSGTLSSTDFIITTSTVPLQVGDRVRIAE